MATARHDSPPSSVPHASRRVAGAHAQIALGTATFLVTFAVWGLPGALATALAERGAWSGAQSGLFVALPILVGALARVPVGMLGDRLGARVVLSILCAVVAVPVALLSSTSSYGSALAAASAVGLAGSSFAVGVAHVSRWATPSSRGTAVGIFGLGNVGQSLALAAAPWLAPVLGLERFLGGVAFILVSWGAVFAVVGRDAPAPTRAPALGEMLHLLRGERLVWSLSATYALTFGGFVALAVYLPTLLTRDLGLAGGDAGLRAAGFVVVATLARPLGGWLSDRFGGARVLGHALAGIAPLSLLLTSTSIAPFTLGALGCAALLGLGNGAVFEIVPRLFPERAGTVTGVVGAVGGLGGFVPPLVLGVLRDELGVVWPGFVLLALCALALVGVTRRALLPHDRGAP